MDQFRTIFLMPLSIRVALLIIFSVAFAWIKISYIQRYVPDYGWSADSYQHFFQSQAIARDFGANWPISLTPWAKPLYKLSVVPIIWLFDASSFFPLQVLNIILISITSYCVYRILRIEGVSFCGSMIGFSLCQLTATLFRASMAPLTEPLFVCLLLMSWVLFGRKRYLPSAFLVGLAVTARIEGLFFVAAWLCFYLWTAWPRWRIKHIAAFAICLLAPVLLWNLAGYLHNGDATYILTSGYPSRRGIYGFGHPTHYLAILAEFDPLVLVGFFLAMAYIPKMIQDKKYLTFFSGMLATSFFLVQTYLYQKGMLGTAGLNRYLVAIIPFMIIPASFALDRLLMLRKPQWWHYIAVATLILTTYHLTRIQFHRSKPNPGANIMQAGLWLRNNVPPSIKVYAERPSITYYARRWQGHGSTKPPTKNARGVVYAWEKNWAWMHGWTIPMLEKKGVHLASFGDQIKIYFVGDHPKKFAKLQSYRATKLRDKSTQQP